MVDKINVNPAAIPPDDGSFSYIQPEFEILYDTIMDSSYTALGRNIIIHLTPQRTVDSSGLEASTLAVHYNPFTRQAPRQVPSNISTTRQPATIMTHRDVVYKAHIKHGPKSPDENGGVELLRGQVQTTTLIESLAHVEEAQSATIDGIRFKRESSRKIGFRDARYIISIWQVINEQENG